MAKKTRYLIILLGFILFICSAPLIVFYVRGLRFDLEQKKFLHTGVLAINSEPASIKIFLDGSLVKNRSGNIRFLLPKEYFVSLYKEGFFPWQKRLQINPDQVTWINYGVEKIFLFRNPGIKKILAENVLDFTYNEKFILYTTSRALTLFQPETNQLIKEVVLPFQLQNSKLQLIPSPNFQSALLISSQKEENPSVHFADFEKKQITDVTNILSDYKDLKVTDENIAVGIKHNSLYTFNFKNRQENLIKKHVLNYAIDEKNLYFTQSAENGLSLIYLETSNGQETKLFANFPAFKNPKILISKNKKIFFVSEEGLFEVNSTLEKIAETPNALHFDSAEPSLIFSTLGEISFFDFQKNEVQLITRTTSETQNLRIDQRLGYAFFIENDQIKTLELDLRGKQNQYLLFESSKIKKFELTPDAKNLIILDNTQLINFQVR